MITKGRMPLVRSTDHKLQLGRVVATPAALAAIADSGQSASDFLARHARGDWGEELPDDDRHMNDQALRDGTRVLSAYRTRNGAKLWVITEADRSSTCLLLPEEY
jgi:hypothetical protein